ncbi:hypothetical protein L1049_017282 [Liquidambar formosana]|uniref:RING-type domain-containing protein n=1 Tax=Liquidambar formosana TaxID=63359 RepID=A0AAP0X436_LIQFO
MEDMDIDQIIDVPDTPDRLAARNINGEECAEKESKLSVASHSGNSGFLDEGVLRRLRGRRGRLVTENGNGRRLHFHPGRNLSNLDEPDLHNNSIVSSLESSSDSRDANSLRRMRADKTSKHEREPSIGDQHMDRGKALWTKFPIKSSSYQENNAVLDLNEQNGHILVTENGHGRRPHFHPRINLSNLDGPELHNSSIVSSLETSSDSRDANSLRRMRADKTSKHESEPSIGAQHMDRRKALWTKFPIKSSSYQENNAVVDLNEQNGHIQIIKKAFSHGASKDPLAEEIKKESTAISNHSSFLCTANSSKTSDNVCKGKEKTDDAKFKGAGLGMDRGKGIDFSSDSQIKTVKNLPSSLHSISPRVAGQKRLVRNGCISPNNIARAKQLAERNSSGSKEVECNDIGNVESNGSSILRELIAEDDNSNRVKGKGVIIHPWISKEHDARTRHLSGRSSITHTEEVNGTTDASRDPFGCFEGLGGWRSTRNRSKKIGFPSSDEAGCLSRKNDGAGCNQRLENRVDNRDNRIGNNNRTGCDYPKVWGAVPSQHGPAPPSAQVPYSLVPESEQVDGRHLVANTLLKRQRKHESTLSNTGECSTSGFGDSELVFLGSSGDPSNSRSTRNQNSRRCGILNPVIEIDESSPEIGLSDSVDISCMNSDDSYARARQVEADEILALELQEQLYQEVPVVGGGETDAHIAWTVQQQHLQHASSRGRNPMLHPRGLSVSPLYRQSRSRSFQNPSSRRGTQARIPPSTRMALGSRVRGQSPSILSRESNLQFPLNMDVDMRINILEALEAAVGDFSDIRMASHIHQVQRDFNENDYEMLLALDENNHQHGASINQINSLPESTVQTDNFEEACAICLETPTSGDTIRHLPCLHKFHKDCIDPWLSRRTSCPVCKLSIT